jgi:excisionase family DNA binding protein
MERLSGHAVRCSAYPRSVQSIRRELDPEHMNAQSLATHLGVTERTVRRWIDRGVLPAEKHGRSYSIRREDGERVRLRMAGGRSSDDHAQLEQSLQDRERDLAELQGRYLELQERVTGLEQGLDEERRRSTRLELELELARRGVDTRLAA